MFCNLRLLTAYRYIYTQFMSNLPLSFITYLAKYNVFIVYMHNSGQKATIKGTDHAKVHMWINSTHDQSIHLLQEVRLTILGNY